MLRPGRAIDEDIIKNEHEPSEEWPKSVIHYHLEGGRRICQVEWHDQELEEALVGAERHFLHIGIMHPHLMVAILEVQLCENDDVV
jgi:hypothetical protein